MTMVPRPAVLTALLLTATFAAIAQTNDAVRAERLRQECIEGRRQICGRVLQRLPDGLVVESGYGALMKPEFNQSWVVRGTAVLQRDASAVEAREPGSVAVGLVFLSDFPKRPPVKQYDYVVLCGYPAGEHDYIPAPGVHKTLRRFAASLDHAVKTSLQRTGAKIP